MWRLLPDFLSCLLLTCGFSYCRVRSSFFGRERVGLAFVKTPVSPLTFCASGLTSLLGLAWPFWPVQFGASFFARCVFFPLALHTLLNAGPFVSLLHSVILALSWKSMLVVNNSILLFWGQPPQHSGSPSLFVQSIRVLRLAVHPAFSRPATDLPQADQPRQRPVFLVAFCFLSVFLFFFWSKVAATPLWNE